MEERKAAVLFTLLPPSLIFGFSIYKTKQCKDRRTKRGLKFTANVFFSCPLFSSCSLSNLRSIGGGAHTKHRKKRRLKETITVAPFICASSSSFNSSSFKVELWQLEPTVFKVSASADVLLKQISVWVKKIRIIQWPWGAVRFLKCIIFSFG